MSDVQSLTTMLQSNNPNKRYDACEALRVLPWLPPEAIDALHIAINDKDFDVADAAKRALEIHRFDSSQNKVTPTEPPTDDEIKLSEEDFSKLSYRQKFALTEYGYLLTSEDADIVGKMLGNIFKAKDILHFCQANGKKVYWFKFKNERESRNDELIIKWVGVILGPIVLVLLFIYLFYRFIQLID